MEKNKALTLFATHYFELTRLALEHKDVANVHLDAVEHKDTVVFLHAVEEGPASQSYGLQVAALAGVPEAGDPAGAPLPAAAGGSERRARQPERPVRLASRRRRSPSRIRCANELQKINPDELSPREALELLYRLKKL